MTQPFDKSVQHRGAPSNGCSRRHFIAQLSSVVGLSSVAGLTLGGPRGLLAMPTSSRELVANTQHGRVRGRALGNVTGFLGVPYGGSTEGEGRFMAATRPVAWKGIRDCDKPGPRAMQGPGTIFSHPVLGPYFSGGRADGPALTDQPSSENCLVLNVLTTRLTGKRPVMVYIHGGGFSSGSAALTLLSDRFVAEQDVVLVGVHHRLGVFGYLYLGDLDQKYADSGNIGQLDLVCALEWVRDNIAGFGGDPENVTIFGESGGGAKISTLLAMPSAKGLFHRAMIESGSLRAVRTKSAAAEDTSKVLARLGVSPERLSELRTIPANRLLAASQASGSMGLIPVVDGRSVPRQTWASGAPPEASGVSLLIGNCKDEATLFSNNEPSLFSLDWKALRAKEIEKGLPESAVDAILGAYRKDYPAESASDLYFRIAGDRGARTNAIAQANAKVEQQNGKVFMYHFDWNTPVAGGRMRAFHTAELPLAMRLVCYPQSEELSKQIAGAWAGFARRGDPGHDGLPTWDPYDATSRATMSFDVGKTRVIHDPAGTEMALLKPYPGGLL